MATKTIARNRTAIIDRILYGAESIHCRYDDPEIRDHASYEAKVWAELQYNRDARLRDHGDGRYTVDCKGYHYEIRMPEPRTMTYADVVAGQTVRVVSRQGWVAEVVRKFTSTDGTEYVELRDEKGASGFNYPHQLELIVGA